jgi:hypothetical protein
MKRANPSPLLDELARALDNLIRRDTKIFSDAQRSRRLEQAERPSGATNSSVVNRQQSPGRMFTRLSKGNCMNGAETQRVEL